VVRASGETFRLPGKANVRLAKGDRVIVDTCGGGGYGLQKAVPESP
jgi:N-methylhydantoinase B/oxoprolinase/acetone carboxylase alpha subunit